MNTQTQLRFFLTCFPGIVRARDTVERTLSHPDNRVLTRQADGETVSVLVYRNNIVLMLCTLPQYRRRGFGGELLAEAEDEIRAAGYDEIRFCDGSSYLTPGIPIGAGYEENADFFAARGYVHSWGEDECVDMDVDLNALAPIGDHIGDRLNGVTYRFAREEDREAVVACAREGHESFAKYYENPDAYRADNPTQVLAAFADGLAVGALFVENQTEEEGVGSVGCTVVRHAYRNRRIATTMVRLGTEYLRSLGIPRGFLGYTYTEIIPMYARAGYAVCMKYLMGVKRL